jgi:hypothetical protein
MSGELRAPLAFGNVAERKPVAEALDPDGNQADANPAVEPLVEQPQLESAGRDLEEAQRGAWPGGGPLLLGLPDPSANQAEQDTCDDDGQHDANERES